MPVNGLFTLNLETIITERAAVSNTAEPDAKRTIFRNRPEQHCGILATRLFSCLS